MDVATSLVHNARQSLDDNQKAVEASLMVTGSHSQVRGANKEGNAIARETGKEGRSAHHIVQDAAVRNLEGYSYSQSPAVSLSNSAHARASATQNVTSNAIRGTLGKEMAVARSALIAAGLTPREVNQAMREARGYFYGILGYTPSTQTREPGREGKGVNKSQDTQSKGKNGDAENISTSER
jgi:hypothetical protein